MGSDTHVRMLSHHRAVTNLRPMRRAAFLRTIFTRKVFLGNGDSGFPLGRMIVFLFNIYLLPLCFHTIFYNLFAFYHRENKAPFCSVEWKFFIKCVPSESCL